MKTTIQILGIIFLHFSSFAQSINIYRGGSIVKTIYGTSLTLNAAVDSAIAGDSIVLSPHKFTDRRVKIDKDLIIQGTQTATDSTIIVQGSRSTIFYIYSKVIAGPSTTVTIRDLIVQDASLICSGSTLPPIIPDSIYGAGIKALENTDVTILGNSIFRNCRLDRTCPSSIITDTNLIGGAAIFSQGKLRIGGNTKFINNVGLSVYSSDICSQKELIIEGNSYFDSGFNSSIAAQGILVIKNNTKIQNHYAGIGGGIYAKNCNVEIGDSVQIIGNTALFGGAGIYTQSSTIVLKNKAVIGGNIGTGISMLKSTLTINDSALVAFNLSNNNFGAGIYNKGGNITITGGQIIGNYYFYDSIPGKGMAIYNDTITGLPAPTLNIANARIFNPTQDFKRTIEVYNETGTSLYSDSTWWGESDTTNLIVNNGSASTILGSWIVADWSINKGLPIGLDTTFPIDAYFKLNSGAAIPPKMFWMLKGLYVCDYGKFNPDTAEMLTSNYISTQYTSSDTTRLVSIVATVDADSFKNAQTITGLSVSKALTNNQSTQFSIYPNPITDFIKIRSKNEIENCDLMIWDLNGKICFQKKVSFQEKEAQIEHSLFNGNYILGITNQNKATHYFKILVHKN